MEIGQETVEIHLPDDAAVMMATNNEGWEKIIKEITTLCVLFSDKS